jgi:putative ABC transport system substrate-binding protein
MRRREFILLIGGTAAWPLAARAQQPGKMPTIGVLGTATPSSWKGWVAAFEKRLRELGWIEGRTIAIAYRWSDGNNERLSEIAAEFARLKPDVIVTTGTGVSAARNAAPGIPIVFAIGRDPVGDGLVKNLARPGGQVTGLSSQATDLTGKRLGLLREIVPEIRRLAIVAEVNDPAAVAEQEEVGAAARKLGLEVATVGVRSPDDDVATAVKALKGRADAIYSGAGAIITVDRSRIFSAAVAAQLPTVSGLRIYAEAGSLLTYGPDYSDLFRRSADYVDKILRGAAPGDIPVEQPTKFELIVNLKTAKAIGAKISDTFLLRADQVLE